MKKLIKYVGDKNFMFPNGMIATPEIIKQKYPATQIFTHVIETDDNCEVIFSIINLSAMRSSYKIDPSLSEEEAITAIEEIINTPPVIDTDPTAEERIAAALEYQVMSSLPDETTESEVV